MTRYSSLRKSAPVERLAVVIPAHNAASTIGEQLDAIQRADHTALAEVIVVDSMSTDSTHAVVEGYGAIWSKVRIVRAQRPGANAARNAGVRASSSDAILLCDADDVVTATWTTIMFEHLQRNDLVCGRYSLELLNDEATIAARGDVASTRAPEDGEFFGGVGGNCAFRRSAWDQLGGLREYHYGGDDAEFFWRAHLGGLRVGYADAAVVEYRLRPDYSGLFRQQMAWSSSRALLYAEFGSEGLIARRTVSDALKSWAWLLVRVRDSWSDDPRSKGRWVRTLADSIGRIRGSMRHRILYP